jgi:hypothetical protein
MDTFHNKPRERLNNTVTRYSVDWILQFSASMCGILVKIQQATIKLLYILNTLVKYEKLQMMDGVLQ